MKQTGHAIRIVDAMPILLSERDRNDGLSFDGSDIFESVYWFLNILEHGLAEDCRSFVRILLIGHASKVMGGLPLIWPTVGDPCIRGLSNFYSSLFGMIGDVGLLDGDAWRKIGSTLKSQPGGSVIRLDPLAKDGPFVRGMRAGLKAAGYWTDDFFCFGNWYLTVKDFTFDNYVASRPSALRNSILRGRRRLNREGAWSISIQLPDDSYLDQAIAAFTSVYAKSWKAPEPFPNFIPGLIRTAAAQGWLRLGILCVGDIPVAAQLWLVKSGKANIYKLAYVKGYERFSVGSVLTAAMMRHVIEVDRVEEVDYLTGDDEYKRDWMSHRRERVGLIAFDPLTLTGLTAAARHFGGRLWRKLLKPLQG